MATFVVRLFSNLVGLLSELWSDLNRLADAVMVLCFRILIWIVIGAAIYFVGLVIFFMIEPTLMPALCKALAHVGVRAENLPCPSLLSVTPTMVP
jgi:hypothetical protein